MDGARGKENREDEIRVFLEFQNIWWLRSILTGAGRKIDLIQ